MCFARRLALDCARLTAGERIILNEPGLNIAREYILQNPLKWAVDRENPMNAL